MRLVAVRPDDIINVNADGRLPDNLTTKAQWRGIARKKQDHLAGPAETELDLANSVSLGERG
jgi:hypothetical protein